MITRSAATIRSLLAAIALMSSACATSNAQTETTAADASTSADLDPAHMAVLEYIEAYNQGDVEAVLAYMAAEEGTYAFRTDPPDTLFALTGYDDVTNLVAWQVASETQLLAPHCMVVGATPRGKVVDCTYLVEDAVRHTRGYTPLPGTLLVTVDPDGAFVDYESLVMLRSGSAFGEYLDWLAAAHPDDVEIAARIEWETREEAIESGRARIKYLDEWSAALASS
jgi:hypothetical protein